MARCEVCGQEIREAHGRKEVNLGVGGKFYHMGCAPDTLVRDALTEWNAIVAKGVKYFVGKFVPNEVRPADYSSLTPQQDNPAAYSNLFTDAGEALRAESKKRSLGV